MTDLMSALYEYILRSRMGNAWNEPEYQHFFQCAQHKEQQLRALLDKEGERVLDDMLTELANQHSVEQEVVFQSTAALCRELRGMVG